MGILPSKEFYQGYIGAQYGHNCSILTSIGEQEQLKKLSDNFGQNKTNVFGQGLLTLTEKVKQSRIISICKV